MREILFKAKNTINDNWVYGYYFVDEGLHKIHSGHTIYTVHPQTVCQFTGELDRNRVKIFEGDKIQGFEYSIKIGEIDAIVFRAGGFNLDNTPEDLIVFTYSLSKYSCEVVGNIHDKSGL